MFVRPDSLLHLHDTELGNVGSSVALRVPFLYIGPRHAASAMLEYPS